jgi:hypothetical protein
MAEKKNDEKEHVYRSMREFEERFWDQYQFGALGI